MDKFGGYPLPGATVEVTSATVDVSGTTGMSGVQVAFLPQTYSSFTVKVTLTDYFDWEATFTPTKIKGARRVDSDGVKTIYLPITLINSTSLVVSERAYSQPRITCVPVSHCI
jgi:type VI protein secretion system component VasA